MTPEVDRIERERRRREDELLILLLALLASVRRDAQVAAVHGIATSPIIASGIVGSPFSGHTGVIPTIARTMAQAHRDGFRRAGLMVGTRAVERSGAGTIAEIAAQYVGQATDAARSMATTLGAAVGQSISEVAQRSPAVMRRAVADAFETSGYTQANSYALDQGAERAVVTAHTTGIMHAAMGGAQDIRNLVTGMEHVTIDDGRETDICHDRIGLRLPIDHPYWLTNMPQLHWGCRSFIRLLTGNFDVSTSLPTIPPMEGFGLMPAGFLLAARQQIST